MFRGEASNRVGRNDRLGGGWDITRSPGKVEEDKRWEVAKTRVGRLVPAAFAQHEGGEGAEECAAPLCCCETGYA